MSDPPPHGVGSTLAADLSAAMVEAGYTNRSLAIALQELRPRGKGDQAKGIESWRGTVRGYRRDPSHERAAVPDEKTAALLEQLLNRPEGFFFRPPARKTARERALEREVERLQRELAEFHRQHEEGRAQGGGGRW